MKNNHMNLMMFTCVFIFLIGPGCVPSEWAHTGFDSDEVGIWKPAGFTPSEAKEWKSDGFTVFDAETWKSRGISPSEAEEWKSAEFTPSDAKKWKSLGFTLSEAEEWKPAGFTPSDAKEWKSAGFTPLDAGTWNSAGISPSEVRNWKSAGVDSSEARSWKSLGVTNPSDVRRWKSAGVTTPSEAAQWINKNLTFHNARKYQLFMKHACPKGVFGLGFVIQNPYSLKGTCINLDFAGVSQYLGRNKALIRILPYNQIAYLNTGSHPIQTTLNGFVLGATLYGVGIVSGVYKYETALRTISIVPYLKMLGNVPPHP